jgi:hypothetical protein
MGDVKKIFGTNKTDEIEGKWNDIGDGIQILVARIGNPEYQKEFQRISKPHKRALRRGSLNDEVAERLLIKVMAKNILLDWKGLEEDGVVVPYSYDNAIRILTEYKDLRDYVSDIANEMESFRADEDEEAEKN